MKKLDIEKKDISLREDNFFPSPEMELLLSIIEIKAYVDDKNINSEYGIESFLPVDENGHYDMEKALEFIMENFELTKNEFDRLEKLWIDGLDSEVDAIKMKKFLENVKKSGTK